MPGAQQHHGEQREQAEDARGGDRNLELRVVGVGRQAAAAEAGQPGGAEFAPGHGLITPPPRGTRRRQPGH